MQKARIRTSWKNKNREISIDEHGVAVSAVAWRVALNAARNLHEQDFVYRDDEQRLGVIREYLYFFIHVADRSIYPLLDDDDRRVFITSLSRECRRHYRENEGEMEISAALAGDFVPQLNCRMNSYAGTRFAGGVPGYEAYRSLGHHIQEIMGNDQTNKWVQDQIIDIDGPGAFEIYNKALTALNKAAARARKSNDSGSDADR